MFFFQTLQAKKIGFQTLETVRDGQPTLTSQVLEFTVPWNQKGHVFPKNKRSTRMTSPTSSGKKRQDESSRSLDAIRDIGKGVVCPTHLHLMFFWTWNPHFHQTGKLGVIPLLIYLAGCVWTLASWSPSNQWLIQWFFSSFSGGSFKLSPLTMRLPGYHGHLISSETSCIYHHQQWMIPCMPWYRWVLRRGPWSILSKDFPTIHHYRYTVIPGSSPKSYKLFLVLTSDWSILFSSLSWRFGISIAFISGTVSGWRTCHWPSWTWDISLFRELPPVYIT